MTISFIPIALLDERMILAKTETKDVGNGLVQVVYTYTLFSQDRFLLPFQWIGAKVFWRIYMWQVLENIRRLAYSDEPYQY